MEPLHEALVEILAAVDAVFLPSRKADRMARLKHQLAGRYPAHGVPWFRAGADDADRKTAQRTRNDLAAAGFVTLCGRGIGGATGIVLTELGESTARALAALHLPCDAPRLLRCIHKLRTDPDGTDGGGGRAWAHETRLCGERLYAQSLYATRKSREILRELEEAAVPSLIRGWVECAAGAGLWYCLTPAGVAALADTPPTTPEKDLPDAEVPAVELYYKALAAAGRALEALPLPHPQDIAPIPMSHSPPLRGRRTEAAPAAETAQSDAGGSPQGQ